MKKHGNISLAKQALTQDIFRILKNVPIQSPVNTTQSIITMLGQTDTKNTISIWTRLTLRLVREKTTLDFYNKTCYDYLSTGQTDKEPLK